VNSLQDSMRNLEAIRNENSRDTNTGKLMVLKVLELPKSLSPQRKTLIYSELYLLHTMW